MKIKHELVLPTVKWECGYLVGIDDAGRSHVFAWDTWKEEYEDQVFFATYSRTGKLKKVTVRKGSELAKELGIDPAWHDTDWPRLQERTGLFPVRGRLYFESKPPNLPYCQEKWLPYGEYYLDDKVVIAIYPADAGVMVVQGGLCESVRTAVPSVKLEEHLAPLTQQESDQILMQLHEQENYFYEQGKKKSFGMLQPT